MATPLNTLEEATARFPFRSGTPPKDMDGAPLGNWELAAFSQSQLVLALQDAANERDALLRGADVTTFPKWRQARIKEGEAYLFCAILCELRGLNDATLGQQADIVSGPGASGSRGADTPNAPERHSHFTKVANTYRAYGTRLIGGMKFHVERTSLGYDEQTFPYEFTLTGAEISV